MNNIRINTYRTLILFFLTLNIAFGQDIRDASLQTYQIKGNTSFQIFHQNQKVRGTLNSITEVTNNTPIELLNSIASEKSIEWVNLNTMYPDTSSKQSYIEKKRANFIKGKGFFGPIMGIFFDENNIKKCCLKFYMGSDTMKQKAAINTTFELRDDKWKKSGSDFYGLDYLFAKTNTKTLSALLEGKATGDAMLDNLIQQTRNKFGGLDYIKFKNVSKSWKENSPEWDAFVQPYCVINQNPKKEEILVPREAKALPITDAKDYAGGCESRFAETPTALDKLDNRELLTFLDQCLKTTTLQSLQGISMGAKPTKLPTFLAKLDKSKLTFINSFRTGIMPTKEKGRFYTLWRFQDKITKEEIILKTTYKDGKYYLITEPYFTDLDWLFENLKPKVFHQTISYQFKENYAYAYPEIEPALALCQQKEYIVSMSIEGVWMLFNELYKNKKSQYFNQK